MEALVFALVLAAAVQHVGSDWWAGVTGREFPSQRYRRERLTAVANYAAARNQARAAKRNAKAAKRSGPPKRRPAREYLGAVWAHEWDYAAERTMARLAARHAAAEQRRASGEPGRARQLVARLRTAYDQAAQRAAAKRGSTERRREVGPATPQAAGVEPKRRVSVDLDKQAETTTQPESEPAQPEGGAADQAPQQPEPEADPVGAQIIQFPTFGGSQDQTDNSDSDNSDNEGDDEMSNGSNGNGKPGGEITGLASGIAYAKAMQRTTTEAARGIETAKAGLQAGQVTGPALTCLAQAQESLTAAANRFAQAAQHLKRHTAVQEAYAANRDAGTKEFVTNE